MLRWKHLSLHVELGRINKGADFIVGGISLGKKGQGRSCLRFVIATGACLRGYSCVVKPRCDDANCIPCSAASVAVTRVGVTSCQGRADNSLRSKTV